MLPTRVGYQKFAVMSWLDWCSLQLALWSRSTWVSLLSLGDWKNLFFSAKFKCRVPRTSWLGNFGPLVIFLGPQPCFVTVGLGGVVGGRGVGEAGTDLGEVKWVNFHTPFSEPPSFFFFFSYPLIIEIIFDFFDIITKIRLPFQNPGSALGRVGVKRQSACPLSEFQTL